MEKWTSNAYVRCQPTETEIRARSIRDNEGNQRGYAVEQSGD